MCSTIHYKSKWKYWAILTFSNKELHWVSHSQTPNCALSFSGWKSFRKYFLWYRMSLKMKPPVVPWSLLILKIRKRPFGSGSRLDCLIQRVGCHVIFQNSKKWIPFKLKCSFQANKERTQMFVYKLQLALGFLECFTTEIPIMN